MEPRLDTPPGPLVPTPRTTIKRHAERGSHDRGALEAILDEAFVCHVAVDVDGTPRVMPTAYVRVGEAVYLHGARANRFLGALAAGAPACIAVTLLDGFVFSRTAFHHSMNYRSVVLYGVGAEVEDPAEKRAALEALIDHMAPGRSREIRPPSEAELRSTLVVRFPISEGSAKMRVGPPLDGPELAADAAWAGELPVRLVSEAPRCDPGLRDGIPLSRAVEARRSSLTGGPGEPYERRRGEWLVSTDPERIDFALVHRFLAEESYWARGIREDAQRRAMDRSLAFGLYRSGEQVGFARVVTDYGRIAYLADVFVVKEARGQGLGGWLVEQVLGHPELEAVDCWLLGTADAHALYERFGFVRAGEERYMVRRSTATRD